MRVGFIVGTPAILAMIGVLTARQGRLVWAQERKGRARQVGEQLTLWLTQGVLPLSYYMFELYRDAARADALDYLYRHETKAGLYPILRQRFSSPETTAALQDKALFARRCAAHGAAAVPALFALFVVDQGVITRFDVGGPGLPRCDLFLKPLTGSGGRGAAVWSYLGGRSYRNVDSGVLSEAQLIDHLVSLSRTGAHVGRLRVANHPELAKVSSGAVCSVRVVTCLDENDRPEVTHAVLRMARTPGIVVDNFHAGGIAAAVNLETGVLGPATDVGVNRQTRWWTSHPTTGETIVGRQIPMWRQIIELAGLAHRAFADQIVVGWDIAVLEGGPQLIEGNKGPDLDIIQRTSRTPIGNSRLGVLLAYHLRRALGEAQSREGSGRGDLEHLDRYTSEESEWPRLRTHG